MEEIIDKLESKFTIIKKIGSGSFGNVYKAKDKNNKYVAIKIEEEKSYSKRLEYEMNLYKELNDGVNVGIPKIKKFYNINKHNVLIMDFLGPSLEDLFEFCNYKFSLKTVGMIALQILDRIEYVHEHYIIHRDIKPDNFLIGTGKEKKHIFIIDFGLSSKIVDNDLNHIIYKKTKNFTGSFRYSSIRNHKGIEQSRRDDLESIGYMLIYFLKGQLPWQGLKGSTKSKRSHQIFKVKRNTSINVLCKDIPNEFTEYIQYVRLLRFKQKPNYKYLKNLFINIFTENDFTYDNVYDWNIIAKEKQKIMKDLSN